MMVPESKVPYLASPSAPSMPLYSLHKSHITSQYTNTMTMSNWNPTDDHATCANTDIPCSAGKKRTECKL